MPDRIVATGRIGSYGKNRSEKVADRIVAMGRIGRRTVATGRIGQIKWQTDSKVAPKLKKKCLHFKCKNYNVFMLCSFFFSSFSEKKAEWVILTWILIKQVIRPVHVSKGKKVIIKMNAIHICINLSTWATGL